jgi:signal transduction histidine kinase
VIGKNIVSAFVILVLFVFGQVVQAQQYSTDSLLQIVNTGPDKNKLEALQLLAQTSRNNNPQLAISYIHQAIDIARNIGDEERLAKSLQILGALEYSNGNYNSAKESYLEALIHFNTSRSQEQVANITAALAGIYLAQGNLPMASDNYLKALRHYEELHNKVGMVNVLSSLGSIYAQQNNFTKSIEYNLKAIALFEESSNKFRALVGYENIGNTYLRQNELGKARLYFNKSLGIYTEMKNKTGVASTLFQLGNIEQQGQQYDKSLVFYKRSLAMCEELKMQPLVVSNLNAMGVSYTELRLYDKAVLHYQKAVKTAKEINSKIELEIAYQGLANIYKLTEEKEKATTFRTLSNELKDSLYNDSNLKKLTDQLLVYESEKKEQQIELLNKEQQIKNVELQREREVSDLLTIAAAVLSVLFIILMWFSIQNRRIALSLRKQQIELLEKNSSIMEQKEKLDQLNTVKDRFFSIISHDLRNNLTTMKLYFDLISNKNYVPGDTTEITRQISGSVENTIDLLENLLVWASAQIKGIPIHIQKLNVHTLSQENINLLSSIAAQKNIELINNVDEHTTAFADIDMINLVLRNLITNAIKFTPENGVVELNASSSLIECVVEVKDNGVGISPENFNRLFNQHEHPTTKGTANEKGTGLGLMLCKDFVERNGGKIWVTSEKDKGTSFFFTLPLEA